MLSCSKTRGFAAVQVLCIFCLDSCVFTPQRGQWAIKRARLRKNPYNGVLTAASIAASKEFKTNACALDLMCCCVLLPKSQLLPQKSAA